MLVFLKDKKYSFIISVAQMTNVLNNCLGSRNTLAKDNTFYNSYKHLFFDNKGFKHYMYILPHLTHLRECLQYVETG